MKPQEMIVAILHRVFFFIRFFQMVFVFFFLSKNEQKKNWNSFSFAVHVLLSIVRTEHNTFPVSTCTIASS